MTLGRMRTISAFIDTILRGEPIPIFFLNYDSTKKVFYIVDGLAAPSELHSNFYYDNKVKLNERFSEIANRGKTFNGENPLDDDQKTQFLNYTLTFRIMEDYDDERVRLIFSRLQRGKPLQIGERLNAKPGEIVQSMRLNSAPSILGKINCRCKEPVRHISGCSSDTILREVQSPSMWH